MEKQENGVIELELKYCERCGALWLRKKESGQVYCASCALQVADMPAPVRRKLRPRLPDPSRDSTHGMSLVRVREGGNA